MEIRFAKIAALLALALSSTAGLADELNYNVYHLTAEAQQRVQNDLMKVTLSASHEANRAADAAAAVNQQMQWALKRDRAKKPLTVSTGQYQTTPVYQNRKIAGWRASQQLHIESDKFSVLTDMLGELQEKLKLDAMQFVPKVQTRRQTEDKLVVEALNQFKTRAKLVASTMQASKYDVVNLSINTGDYRPPIPHMRMDMMAMKAEGVAAPAVEAGSSTVSVSVSGGIQLRHD